MVYSDNELNRISWDTLAEAHGQDAYYDSAALISGQSSLIAEEEEALGEAIGTDLRDLSLLHLQCHIGFDAITLARRGARVTGIDFSDVALTKAASLAQQCGVDVEWICEDACALPAGLKGQFDLVWATQGIICWIADLEVWMASVASVLKGGGRLVLIDGYPPSAGAAGNRSTGTVPVRRFIESGWDYASPIRTGPQVQFRHTIESVIAAAGRAGLTILSFNDHRAVSADLCIPHVERGEDGMYRRLVEGVAQPILFTMIAVR